MHVMKFCAAAAAAILFAVTAPGIATAQIEASPAFRDDKPEACAASQGTAEAAS